MSDTHMEVDDVDQAGSPAGTPPAPKDKPSDQSKGKATAKPTVALSREPGKSLLPISRVQKIMKADKVHAPSCSTRFIIFDEASGIAYCREGSHISHITGNGRIHQKVIGG
jgi:hypothetical protein